MDYVNEGVLAVVAPAPEQKGDASAGRMGAGVEAPPAAFFKVQAAAFTILVPQSPSNPECLTLQLGGFTVLHQNLANFGGGRTDLALRGVQFLDHGGNGLVETPVQIALKVVLPSPLGESREEQVSRRALPPLPPLLILTPHAGDEGRDEDLGHQPRHHARVLRVHHAHAGRQRGQRGHVLEGGGRARKVRGGLPGDHHDARGHHGEPGGPQGRVL